MDNRGGKRPGAGRKKGTTKINKTFSIDADVADNKPTSALVNQLLKSHFEKQ